MVNASAVTCSLRARISDFGITNTNIQCRKHIHKGTLSRASFCQLSVMMLKINPASYLLPGKKLITPSSHFVNNNTTNTTSTSTFPTGNRGATVNMTATDTTTTTTTSSPPKSKMTSYFPLGYKEAAQQWWSSVSLRQAEHGVLSFIPYLREATTSSSTSQTLSGLAKTDPFGHRVWKTTMVPLSGKNRALNEFSIERLNEPITNNLVMLHGYGAGLGFFYKNFEPLSRLPGWKLYALDMLGMGNSTRPPFKIHSKDHKAKIAEAESWFIDALEEWRKARNLEKFTLMGHSMGGYMAVSYALKYPGRLNKLILVSPVGIPEDPWAVDAAMPEPESSTMAAEFTQDQESIVSRKPAGNNAGYLAAKDKKAAAQTSSISTTPPKRPLPGWLVWLWDANVSPFSVVRMAGPLGPRLVSGWSARRFNHLPAPEKESLHNYTYALCQQTGSGEYAMPYILAPGAYARSPLINRIQEVGRGVIRPASENTPEVRENGIPIVFMYGENDWMDVAGGYAAEEKIKKRRESELLKGEGEEKGSAKVVVVRRAGHHLYLDNPEEFNAVVRAEMESVGK
ncbi:putative cardiolipin-specific deacylase, mitochondrial [Podospora fimiseda]|uniref:Cardiolipin-specific deacylase, mitochondrial n=1 Tax=Podospora fimiseda TaxID=252190 RepID=A0AAN7BSS8_9PEZI|nr:putative cardiolipin-specific deacylase, mitochondrial [Podospora fimiseda]